MRRYIFITLLILPLLLGAAAPDITAGADRNPGPLPAATPDGAEGGQNLRERERRAREARAARKAAGRSDNNRIPPTIASPSAGNTNSSARATNIRDIKACATQGLALAGTDVVSYYKDSGPLPGIPQFVADHGGLRYRFANRKNRTRFLVDPEAFLPEYLGWCATHLALGSLNCPDPQNYKIVGGKLLLFAATQSDNARDTWESDPLKHTRDARKNLVSLLRAGSP